MRKYQIDKIIKQKPSEKRQAIRKEIRETLKMSPVMYSRYIHADTSQTLDLDGYKLLTIAEILECSIDDLFVKKSKVTEKGLV